MNPAIRTASGWTELDGLWIDDIEDLLPNALCWRDVPGFVQSLPATDIFDYVQGLQECREVCLPEEIYERMCLEHKAVLAPSNIALFGDGSVRSDKDIARAWAEACEEEEAPDLTERGRQLREDEGCVVIDGIVAQYT